MDTFLEQRPLCLEPRASIRVAQLLKKKKEGRKSAGNRFTYSSPSFSMDTRIGTASTSKWSASRRLTKISRDRETKQESMASAARVDLLELGRSR